MGHVLTKMPILPKVRGTIKAKNELNPIVYGLIKKKRQEIRGEGTVYNDLITRLVQARDPEGNIALALGIVFLLARLIVYLTEKY